MVQTTLQRRLSGFRLPQVDLTYEIEQEGCLTDRALPFVVGVLADLSGHPAERLPPLRERKFVPIDRDCFNAVLNQIRPRLDLSVPRTMQGPHADPQLSVTLSFQSLDDFSPEAVASQIPTLRELLSLRDSLTTVRAALIEDHRLEQNAYQLLINPPRFANLLEDMQAITSASSAVASPALNRPDKAIEEFFRLARIGDSPSSRIAAAQFTEALRHISRSGVPITPDLEPILTACLSTLDTSLTQQLNQVMHHQDFQRLEASWRALWFFVDRTEVSPSLQIRVLNATKKELSRDLERAVEFDRSALFKHVYEDVYGTSDANPFSLLIGDFSVQPRDLGFLTRLAQVSAAIHAPFIADAAPELFSLDSFADLNQPRDLTKIFELAEHARWRLFRQSPDSQFIGLVLPGMLLRVPYGTHTNPVQKFSFEEEITTHDHYLWGTAAFALGACITAAFASSKWFAGIKGAEGVGLLRDLPTCTTLTGDGVTNTTGPTQITISERRENELAHLGFIPLLHVKNTGSGVFFSIPSCYNLRTNNDRQTDPADVVAVGLDYVLTISRFSHYLRCLFRDKMGRFYEASHCEQFLNRWLSEYVAADSVNRDDPKLPLQYGKVQVTEASGQPGLFQAVLVIRPSFKFSPMSLPLRAVVLLPQRS